ncbi:hypothetical protein [Sphingomonas turrisvirgatae]|uniref:Uncharacterized protein n=1 Tax=Sphingomonas turrisvirgatae TaxID=1888892 RepID=A0A1E3LXN9_9SPHN|nr:hypothetical protein [Sphingomonas turrisvirgatae]ODP38582.1 hypothetical protein BFL28_00620 [Sphingomonas turrisvirgatae]
MARLAPCSDRTAPDTGYRVELPRQGDAIGTVLRDAFDSDHGLPDDMMMLLRKMSARPATSRDH